MNHLTIDEIIEFVSFEEIDESTLELSKKVNGHICKCQECLNRVKAFQMIYDEFYRLNTGIDFMDYLFEQGIKCEEETAGLEANI